MKKLEKKIYEVLNEQTGEPEVVTTVMLLKAALGNMKLNANGQPEGFSSEDILIRVDINKAISGSSKEIKFEEEQAKAIVQYVNDTRWATYNEALADFIISVRNMQTYDINA